MRYIILFLLLSTATHGNATTLDSLVRHRIGQTYYYTENDTHHYTLSQRDLDRIHLPDPQPTHFYGVSRLGPNRLFLHFERNDRKGRQAILITCDTLFTNQQVMRIGLRGRYFIEYDNGRTLPLYRDSTRAYMIIDRILPYTGLDGLSVKVYTNFKAYNKSITTARKDLWQAFYQIQADGAFRRIPALEHFARFGMSPLRGYDTIMYVDPSHSTRANAPLPLNDLAPYIPDSLISRDDTKVYYQYAFILNKAIRVVHLRLHYDQPDTTFEGITDLLLAVDTNFNLIDRLAVPLAGKEAVAYNNGRIPNEFLNMSCAPVTVTRHLKNDAQGHFTISSGSCGMGTDPIGHPVLMPDGWVEYWRITRAGRFAHDSTTINGCRTRNSRPPALKDVEITR